MKDQPDIGVMISGTDYARYKELETQLAEMKGRVITIKGCYENESLEHDKTRAQLAELKPYLRHDWRTDGITCTDAKCACGLQAILDKS